MEGYKRILILSGILILPLLVWFGFNHSNSLISFVQPAYGAESNDDHSTAEADEHKGASIDDHSAIETTEKMTTGPANQHTPNTETEPGSILLPQKRTTLLRKTQLRGYASYQYYCAVCHGKGGGGNGSNAKFLSTPPRRHNDAPYMANLSDAHLSRVIKEGGASQGLSPLMPPWGGALSDEEISNLIAFLRILPESQMMASIEEHQKSTEMMGGHHGGAEAEGHQAAEADEHMSAGTDDHHADEADDHKAATTDDH